MKILQYSEYNRKQTLTELSKIKEIQRLYCEMIFVLSYEELDVKSGSDSFKDYVHYFVYSPLQGIIELCKEIHLDVSMPTAKSINEFGYTFHYTDPKCRVEKPPQNTKEVFDVLSAHLLDRFLVDYKIYGKNIIDFYDLDLNLTVYYSGFMGGDEVRFREFLGAARYRGGLDNIEYKKHVINAHILDLEEKGKTDEISKLSKLDQVVWLKHKFEKRIFNIWEEGKHWSRQKNKI